MLESILVVLIMLVFFFAGMILQFVGDVGSGKFLGRLYVPALVLVLTIIGFLGIRFFGANIYYIALFLLLLFTLGRIILWYSKKTESFDIMLPWKVWYSIVENPLIAGFVVLVGIGAIVVLISLRHYDLEYWEGITVEAHGMILDIGIIGIFVLWLNKLGDKRAKIRLHEDEIDDFRKWKSKEAMFRITGNIRRLGRLGKTNVDIRDCFLRKADLSFANLLRANLERADLRHTNFYSAKLDETNITSADLRKARVSNASLKGAYLICADLRNADLSRVDLRDAALGLTKLQGCNLSDADLTGADFEKAKSSNSTTFPANFKPDDHGMILVEDD